MSKSKKSDPSQRAKSTTALNSVPVHTQPLPPHPSLTAFDRAHTLCAAVFPTRVADGQLIRVMDVNTSAIVSEWSLPLDTEKKGARAVAWCHVTETNGIDASTDDGSSKKRRKRKSSTGHASGSDVTGRETNEVVIVSQGSTLYQYSVGQPKPIRTIVLEAPLLAMTVFANGSETFILAVTSTMLQAIDPASGNIHLSTPLPDNFVNHSALATKSPSLSISSLNVVDSSLYVAIASTNLAIASLPLPLVSSSKEKVEWSGSQSISIEPIRTITPLAPLDTNLRFITTEQESRVATVWSYNPQQSIMDTIATIPSASTEPIHSLNVSGSTLALTSLSGEIGVYSVSPSSFTVSSQSASSVAQAAAGKKKRSNKKTAPIPLLQPVSTVKIVTPSAGNQDVEMRVLDAWPLTADRSTDMDNDEMQVDNEEENQSTVEQILVGWVGGGARVRWETIVSLLTHRAFNMC